jgi:hypothetical protein
MDSGVYRASIICMDFYTANNIDMGRVVYMASCNGLDTGVYTDRYLYVPYKALLLWP